MDKLICSGGIGNQMFQYAFYLARKKEHVETIFDTSYFLVKQAHNGYELDRVFNINQSKKSVFGVLDVIVANYLSKRSRTRNAISVGFSNIIFDRDLEYKKYINVGGKNVFYGTWMSEHFFKNVKDDIIKAFTFSFSDDENMIYEKQMIEGESVSVHIRRGDYVDNALYSGICNLEYYNKAFEYMDNHLYPKPKYYFFSDDIDWVKNNFSIENAVFVNWNKEEDSFKDMYLMSKCKHNIIANSTFSWWGAWLNQYNNKIVIAPRNWINDNRCIKEIIPENWIRI